jgi:hypothetical protein
VGADDIFGEFVNRTGGDAAAFIQDAELAGHTSGKRQFLLDQENREVFFPIQL